MIFRWERTHFLILTIIVFMLLVGGYHLYNQWIVPELTEIEQSREEFENQNLLIDSARLDDRDLDTMLKDAQQLENYLPISPRVDQLLIDLARNAEDTNVIIERLVKTSTQFAGDHVTFYPEVETVQYQLTLQFDSDHDLNQFLANIIALERIIDITQLNYQERATGEVSATLTLIAFYNPTLHTLQQ